MKDIKSDDLRPLPPGKPVPPPQVGERMPKAEPKPPVRDGKTSRDIIAAIAERYGLTVEKVTGPCRRSDYVAARREIYQALQARGLSTTRIGQLVGGRDHTTVLFALRASKAEARA